MTSTKATNIYQKILEIRKEIPTLQKNGELKLGNNSGYKFLAIDDILATVKPIEERHGVIVVMEDSDVSFHYNTALAKEDGRAPAEKVQAHGYFTFVAVNTEAEDPDKDSYRFVVPSEGGDTSDKATRKTVTQAQKIAYITLYNLITGEPDPDGSEGANEGDTPVPAAVAKAQSKPAAEPATRETPRTVIKEKYIDTKKKTRDEVNALVAEVKKSDLTGEAIYVEVLKRLDAE